jgi:hypothetical protein
LPNFHRSRIAVFVIRNARMSNEPFGGVRMYRRRPTNKTIIEPLKTINGIR